MLVHWQLPGSLHGTEQTWHPGTNYSLNGTCKLYEMVTFLFKNWSYRAVDGSFWKLRMRHSNTARTRHSLASAYVEHQLTIKRIIMLKYTTAFRCIINFLWHLSTWTGVLSSSVCLTSQKRAVLRRKRTHSFGAHSVSIFKAFWVFYQSPLETFLPPCRPEIRKRFRDRTWVFKYGKIAFTVFHFDGGKRT